VYINILAARMTLHVLIKLIKMHVVSRAIYLQIVLHVMHWFDIVNRNASHFQLICKNSSCSFNSHIDQYLMHAILMHFAL
jgi:hypothetical protein